MHICFHKDKKIQLTKMYFEKLLAKKNTKYSVSKAIKNINRPKNSNTVYEEI